MQRFYVLLAGEEAKRGARNASEPSLLWAVGRTPFGPYSARAELSFALRDAAART